MLSVFSTLGEALHLGARHFWLLISLAVFAAIPMELPVLIGFENGNPPNVASGGATIVKALVAVIALVGMVIVAAAKTAAILGVLKNNQQELSAMEAMAGSIRTYTWPLVRLSLLLMLIAFLAWMPLGFIIVPLAAMHADYSSQIILALVAIVYLIFVKFALANPLVVVENMLARAAVHKSWEMTKGRFWYVLGCYVFLGGAQYFLTWLSSFLEPKSHHIITSLADGTISSFLDSFWVLTGWCMYHRIKTADGSPAPPAEVPTQSPPESPSASQSA